MKQGGRAMRSVLAVIAVASVLVTGRGYAEITKERHCKVLAGFVRNFTETRIKGILSEDEERQLLLQTTPKGSDQDKLLSILDIIYHTEKSTMSPKEFAATTFKSCMESNSN